MYISKFIAISILVITPLFSVLGGNVEKIEDRGNAKLSSSHVVSEAKTDSDINRTLNKYDTSCAIVIEGQKEQAIESFKRAAQKGYEEALIARFSDPMQDIAIYIYEKNQTLVIRKRNDK